MRTDPTDTGGLFIGRRPGTGPIRYRALPERGSRRRQRMDGALAVLILLALALVNLSFWGPLPVAWLWVGSHVDYATGSVSLGIFVAFIGLLFTLLGGLVVMRALDEAWILVRRAAGHDQRTGTIARIFVITAGIGAVSFTVWLVLFAGLSPTLAPRLT
jgi:uncharacterized membrane protein